MKKSILGLAVIITGSIIFTSCSSENNVLSQFSKRKYLKNVKETKHNEKHAAEEIYFTKVTPSSAVETIREETIVQIKNNEVSTEMETIENPTKPELKKPVSVMRTNKQVKKAFATWKKESENINLIEANVLPNTALELNKLTLNNNAASDIHPVVLVLLSIFLPPLAVYLYQDAIENDFWLDVILTLLLIVPGIVYAFLVVFGNVSIN